jgi:hypothetical protein
VPPERVTNKPRAGPQLRKRLPMVLFTILNFVDHIDYIPKL